VTKAIQAYFRTENEAEDVRILLQKYDTDMLEVGVIEDGVNRDDLFLPLAAGFTSNGTGLNGAGAAAAVRDGDTAAIPLLGFAAAQDDEASDKLHYALSVQVNDSDYDEIVLLIRSNQGHVAREE
jgi:hypothetical protein